MWRWFALVLVIALAVMLAGCKSQQASESQTSSTTTTAARPAQPAASAPAPAAKPAAAASKESANVEAARKLGTASENPVVATASGLEYIDVKVGAGAEAKAGQMVSVHYTGWLVNGTKFDSSVDRGQPFKFPLGGGRVIKGWDEGVAGMKVGGVRKLIIPSDLGYGSSGAGGVIPPNATLVFEVQLLGVQ
jgi:FKBP-type peptidyl-prolyl cis-trans isomerase FkpA